MQTLTFRTSHLCPNLNFEHIEPKTKLQTCRLFHKTEQFANIELLVPRLYSGYSLIIKPFWTCLNDQGNESLHI